MIDVYVKTTVLQGERRNTPHFEASERFGLLLRCHAQPFDANRLRQPPELQLPISSDHDQQRFALWRENYQCCVDLGHGKTTVVCNALSRVNRFGKVDDLVGYTMRFE